jgi:hypothetical protein
MAIVQIALAPVGVRLPAEVAGLRVQVSRETVNAVGQSASSTAPNQATTHPPLVLPRISSGYLASLTASMAFSGPAMMSSAILRNNRNFPGYFAKPYRF